MSIVTHNSFLDTLSDPKVFSEVTGQNPDNATMRKLALCSKIICALVRTALTDVANVWKNNLKGERKPPEHDLPLGMGLAMKRFFDSQARLVVHAADNPDSPLATLPNAKLQTAELMRKLLTRENLVSYPMRK